MTAKTPAERQRAYKARKQANGFKQLNLIAPAELHDAIRRAAQRIIESEPSAPHSPPNTHRSSQS